MKAKSIQIFKSNADKLLELWMSKQLSNATLRDDLMNNEDLRVQSGELVNSLVNSLTDENISDPKNNAFSNVTDILESISLSRAKQGFSPRETGLYVFSLKEALLETGRIFFRYGVHQTRFHYLLLRP